MSSSNDDRLYAEFLTNMEIMSSNSDPSFLILAVETKRESDHEDPKRFLFALDSE